MQSRPPQVGIYGQDVIVNAQGESCRQVGKPRPDIVALLAPLYVVIIFVIPLEVKPTVLLQLLFAASLTVLVIRLNIRFSTLPARDKYEDPMDKFLYAYMHRITPYFRSIDSDTAHEIASAVLSFKFGIYPNTIGSADKAITRLKGEGAFATLRKALTIMRDRAESLQESMVKSYSEKTFSADDFQYLAIVLPPELIESPENFSLAAFGSTFFNLSGHVQGFLSNP